MTGECFVAVHIGAGSHSLSRTGMYREICEKVCRQTMEQLRNGCEARKAVAYAVSLLENAGIGSNLTLDGNVECDASIMDEIGYGSVGAVTNIKNPIMVALTLLENQINGHLSFGRIAPCMLVGDGAKKWALEHNIPLIDSNQLKTDVSIKTHQTYLNKMREFEVKQEAQDTKLDTVGAIVIDMYGNISSAASSGGILLKHPGRIGHASMYGCGCWVDQSTLTQSKVAICTTGCGEHIFKTLFAKECSDLVLNCELDAILLDRIFKDKFFDSQKLNMFKEKLIGILLCKLDETGIDLYACHTTSSMCYAFMSSNMNEPLSTMSRLQDSNVKNKVVINNFRLSKTQNKDKDKINDYESNNNNNSKKFKIDS